MADHFHENFCILPWMHLNLNPDGAVTLCCQSHEPIRDQNGRRLNAQTHSLDEIWNSEPMMDIRRRTVAGERLPNCRACFANERFGRQSYRTASNEKWLNEHPEIADQINSQSNGHVSHKPLYFDLRIGNICNLKCTSCKPLYSSQIERDPVHSKWAVGAPYIRTENRFNQNGGWENAKLLRDEIVNISDDVKIIQLSGGEPTINKTQVALLKELCDTGRAAEIDLEISSNLSNVKFEIVEIFSKFRNLNIKISIDGHGSTYEYVRFPGKWNSLTKNINKIRDYLPTASMAVYPVFQAVNAYNMIDLFEWSNAEDLPVVPAIGRGLDDYNDVRILPLEMRQKLRERFNSLLSGQKTNNEIGQDFCSINSIFEEFDVTDFDEELRSERLANFMQFINDLDKSRNLLFRETAPEMYDDIVSHYGFWETDTRFS